jgi:hypothetical protein
MRLKNKLKKENIKKTEKNGSNWKRLVLPLFVFLLFIGSSIAIFLSYKPSNIYNDPNLEIVEKILEKENADFKEIIPYGKGDFFYVYQVVLDKDKVLPFYLTFDRRFFSIIALEKFSNKTGNESLREILTLYHNYFPVIPKKFKEIENNDYYTVYVVDPNEPYYQQWQSIYFLVGNKTILLAQPNPLS